jgi:glyoxylase-like metal-dependent hydrolase (beta-lactamase superfamily II)
MKEIFFSQIEVGHHAVFAYLIGDLDTGEAAIVDPADNVDDLIALSRQHNLDIQTIINTHGHVDHIMGNAEMKEKTSASIAIHVDEAEYLSKIGRFWLDMFNARKSPPADILLQDGDVVSVGRFDWKVLHTPGHTPGGICLYNVEYGYCLTGDTLFVGSVGRIDGPKASGSQMLEAIRSKLLSLPDETNIFPGHNYGFKEASTIAEERSSNPFINGDMTSMIL